MKQMLPLAALFICFLYPVSVNGVSVNYSFALLPIVYVLSTGRIRKPHPIHLALICLYTAICAVAFLYQTDLSDQSLRRMISFAIFMTTFAFVVMEFNPNTIAAFKLSIVAISMLFSLRSFYLFLTSGASTLGFDAKDVVGSQRFGFVYIVAIWIALLDMPLKLRNAAVHYLILLVLLVGLLLTFSRSSVVALLGSVALFAAVNITSWSFRPGLRSLLRGIMIAAGLTFLVFLVFRMVPTALEFMEVRLYNSVIDYTLAANLSDPGTSEGARWFIAREAMAYVKHNPLTGSGFLGIWILPSGFTGSAHNQYLDVLFRTGVIGFLGYAALLVLIIAKLRHMQKALCWGFVGVIIYGFFHETFKESQGAFLLAFLVGIVSTAANAESDTQHLPTD